MPSSLVPSGSVRRCSAGNVGQQVEPAVGRQLGTGPRERRLDRVEERPQRRVALDVCRDAAAGRCAGDDVAIGVAPYEANAAELGQPLERGDRIRSDRDQVTEHPPLLDVVRVAVGHDRIERDPVAVDVGDQRDAHRSSLPGQARARDVRGEVAGPGARGRRAASRCRAGRSTRPRACRGSRAASRRREHGGEVDDAASGRRRAPACGRGVPWRSCTWSASSSSSHGSPPQSAT